MYEQAKGLRELVANNPRVGTGNLRVLAVASGKGGVGKTNFTVNLALALAGFGYRVVIMDGDLGLANVDVAFGLFPRYTIEHLLSGDKSIEEILIEGPKGIKVLPGGSGVQELANLDVAQLSYVVKNLGRLERFADILLIDTGAGLGEVVLNFLMAADDVILVTTREPTAITDAYGLLKTLLSRTQEKNIHVVINRVRSEADARETYERLDIAVRRFLHGALNFLGWIYEDPHVGKAVMAQEPIGIKYPDCPANRCINWIAGSVAGIYLNPPRPAGGIRGFLASILKTRK